MPRLVDVTAASALVVAAWLARREMLPRDGVWGDDSWAVFGAARGSVSNILAVGFSHPGFTGALMAWNRVVGTPERMADLTFVAGVLTPALVYVSLRRFGYASSISLLFGAALVAVDLHVLFSGRVKTYVIDALVVLLLAAAVPRVARLRWNARVAALWVAGSVAAGFFSPFALIATGVAGATLLLRTEKDFPLRAVAVSMQGAGYLALTWEVRRRYSSGKLELWWEQQYDAFVDVSVPPLQFAADILTHVRRVAVVLSGGPAWWASVCLAVAVIGLAADALVRRRTARALRAQYLLLLLFVALAGGVIGVLPFGPASAGKRVSIWLIPVFVVGLAAALQRARDAAARNRTVHSVFDLGAIVISALLVLNATVDVPKYPRLGSRSATEFVEAQLGSRDAVLIDQVTGMYAYAVASRLEVEVEATPNSKVAFRPRFRDQRVHYIAYAGERGAELRLITTSAADRETDVPGALDGAEHVFVVMMVAEKIPRAGAQALAAVLHSSGYTQEAQATFGIARVDTWRRSSVGDQSVTAGARSDRARR